MLIEFRGKSELVETHWDVLAATDFFNVDSWTLKGLVRYDILFVFRLANRQVRIAGIAPRADGIRMEQVARNLTDPIDGFLRECHYLIHNPAPAFSGAFAEILSNTGVEPVQLPPRSPNLSAYAERFVRTIKERCLERSSRAGGCCRM